MRCGQCYTVVSTVTRTYGHLDYLVPWYLGYSVSPWKSYFGIRLFVMSIVPNVLLCPMEVPDTPLFLIMPLSTQSMCKRKAVLLFDLRLAGWPTPAVAAQENQEHTYNFTYDRTLEVRCINSHVHFSSK